MTKLSWIDAMQEEIHEFKRLQVQELVSCLDKVFFIKVKWIYKVKKDKFGGVLKNKARVVSQGFRQEEDIPLVEKSKLDEDLHGKPVDATLYCGMIGSLMNLTSSRLDLIHEVCLCACCHAKPIEKHLQADTRRSTSGSAQFLCEKLVSWSSKKQKCTAISST
nr:hypothetical protein [Tanacetum cinerariifolium]GEZ54810.1 hypothetical protein [Tanacetum cinerariifolium]